MLRQPPLTEIRNGLPTSFLDSLRRRRVLRRQRVAIRQRRSTRWRHAIRWRVTRRRPAVPVRGPGQRAARERRGVRQRHRAGQPGRLLRAVAGRGPGRAGLAGLQRSLQAQQPSGGHDRALPVPRRQRAHRGRRRPCAARGPLPTLPPGRRIQGPLRHHAGRARLRAGGRPDPVHHLRPGRRGHLPLPRRLALDPHPDAGHPGLAHRRLCGALRAGLLRQHDHPVRDHPGHRGGGGRQHRGGGERAARHGRDRAGRSRVSSPTARSRLRVAGRAARRRRSSCPGPSARGRG